jgi:hypothetical protein
MRKIFSAAIISAVILLSAAGCSVLSTGALNFGITKLDLDKEQTLTARIHYSVPDKRLVTAEMHRFGPQVWESSISDPYPLQGINVYSDKGTSTLTFSDLSVQENPGFVSVLDIVTATLEDSFTGSPKVKAHRKTVTLTGETAFGKYTLKIENQKPSLLEISEKNNSKGIKVEFV